MFTVAAVEQVQPGAGGNARGNDRAMFAAADHSRPLAHISARPAGTAAGAITTRLVGALVDPGGHGSVLRYQRSA
jgi:hypothetical protein